MNIENRRLSRNVFVEAYEGTFFVYAPLKKLAFPVDAEGATFLKGLYGSGLKSVPEQQQALFTFIESLRLLEEEEEPARRPSEASVFEPVSVYLLLTSACNLRCQYCFSSAGEHVANMPLHLARAAVDLVIRNAIGRSATVKLRYHGGGEPTLNWEVLTESARYARQEASRHSLRVEIALNTNGVLPDIKRQWIAEHVDQICISLDGPASVQDTQRPLRRSGSSTEQVLDTMAWFTRRGRSFRIRATVTKSSSRHLVELVNLVAPFLVEGIDVEPMTMCGRAYESGVMCPTPAEFIRAYGEARAHAESVNKKVVFSGARLGLVGSTFCGAAGRNLAISPTGLCSLCHRISDPRYQGANQFVIGAYEDRSGTFVLDHTKVAAARALHCDDAAACSSCFAKWNCGGGCYAQNAEETGEVLLADRIGRCAMTRDLIASALVDKIRRLR